MKLLPKLLVSLTALIACSIPTFAFVQLRFYSRLSGVWGEFVSSDEALFFFIPMQGALLGACVVLFVALWRRHNRLGAV